MKITGIVLVVLVLIPCTAGARDILSPESSKYRVFIDIEGGFTAIPYHTLQIGKPGTSFDYHEQGGQDILFPGIRYAAGVGINDTHRIEFLYNPLEINTSVVFDEDVTIDTVTFPAGTPMDLKYSFPFWRLTYRYIFHPSERLSIGTGAALQLRNASIVFAAKNGTALTVSQNLGPVPALSFSARYDTDSGLFVFFDITGIYASSAIVNGADFNFEGSLLDAGLRTGLMLNHGAELFAGVRFLGGSAVGESEYTDRTWSESESAYTANRLATISCVIGITLH